MMRFVFLFWAFLAAPLAAVEAIPGYEGQIRDVVERALKQYRSAQSYQDKLQIRVEVEESGQQSADSQELVLAFTRPNRVALTTPAYDLVSDGKTLWQRIPLLEQYVESSAGKQLNLDKLALSQFAFYGDLQHPVATVLIQADASVTQLLGPVVEFATIQNKALGDQPGYRVSAIKKVQVGPNQFKKAPLEAWFNKDTGLLEEIRSDYTELVKANANRQGVGRFIHYQRFEAIALNRPIPDERFTFKPGRYDEKMRDFRILGSEEFQRKLLGRPAPDFNGTDFHGKELSLASLRGRVVVLDFWATFCGPCIMAMPQMQKLADKYARKDVSVIGINGDSRQERARVTDALKRTKVKFRQLMDPENKAFQAYRIGPIPCTILIGKAGLLQAIHLGYNPAEAPILSHEIDKLLKGENLFSPKASSSKSP